MELERWHRVDNILQAALALNPAERSIFVDSACEGDESLRDEVYRSILHFVRVTGQAKEDQLANRIVSITISDIERIEAKEDQVTDVLPTGAPLPSDFWQTMSFDELASAQGVGPLLNVHAIMGTWPGDVDDGFEDAVEKLRHAGRKS